MNSREFYLLMYLTSKLGNDESWKFILHGAEECPTEMFWFLSRYNLFSLCLLGFTKPVSAEMPDKTPGGTEPVPRTEGE